SNQTSVCVAVAISVLAVGCASEYRWTQARVQSLGDGTRVAMSSVTASRDRAFGSDPEQEAGRGEYLVPTIEIDSPRPQEVARISWAAAGIAECTDGI